MKRREIPGTTVFDGAQARKGYALNRMCYSFNDAANRAEFLRDEDAYCRRFGLSEAQRAAIRRRNVLVQDIGAQQTGMTMVHSKEEAFEARDAEPGDQEARQARAPRQPDRLPGER